MPRQFRLSVRLSVTCMLCVKTAERIIEILSLYDRPSEGICAGLIDIMHPATLHGVGVITKVYFAILRHLRNQ